MSSSFSFFFTEKGDKLDFLRQASKLDNSGTLHKIVTQLEELKSFVPNVLQDFFLETLKLFRSTISENVHPAELVCFLSFFLSFPCHHLTLFFVLQRVFREFAHLWSLEERLQLLGDKFQPYREMDQAWETSYFEVDLDNLLSSSRRIITPSLPKIISTEKALRIRYVSSRSGTQQGQDDGGLCRDWFHRLSNELVEPKHSLLKAQDEVFTGRFQLDLEKEAESSAAREHLLFLGRMMGIALVLNIPLSVDFIPLFYKFLVKQEYDVQDLEFVDNALLRSLKKLEELSQGSAENFATAADSITFTRSNQSDAEEVQLTKENFLEFKALKLRQKLHGDQHERMALVRSGLAEYLPFQYLVLLDSEELRSLINPGGPSSSLFPEWKRLTTYEDLSPDSVIKIFPLLLCLSLLSPAHSLFDDM